MGDGIPMDKIRNLSVRKTIFLYMAAALFCSFLLSDVIVRIAERTQMRIWWNYIDKKAYVEAAEKKAPGYIVKIPRPSSYEMTQADIFVSELCDFLETYAVLILSMAGSCGAVFLFYRNKLREPLEELGRAGSTPGSRFRAAARSSARSAMDGTVASAGRAASRRALRRDAVTCGEVERGRLAYATVGGG